MPAIAQKARSLGGKGVVLSYVDKPENFYWREQVHGTKRYLHRLLPNSSTLEEALEECIEGYTALRQEQAIPYSPDGTSTGLLGRSLSLCRAITEGGNCIQSPSTFVAICLC